MRSGSEEGFKDDDANDSATESQWGGKDARGKEKENMATRRDKKGKTDERVKE
jgi:hypothetical protein